MSKLPGLTAIGSSGPIETLHHALDQTYRRLIEAAKADWNRLFTDPDPNADCVSVKISKDRIAEELAGIPQTRFIPVKQPPSFIVTVRGPWRR